MPVEGGFFTRGRQIHLDSYETEAVEYFFYFPMPGDFEHYLLPVIYPPGLTREVQIALGLGLLVINALVYRAVWCRWRSRRP